jgi:hypothetical protein
MQTLPSFSSQHFSTLTFMHLHLAIQQKQTQHKEKNRILPGAAATVKGSYTEVGGFCQVLMLQPLPPPPAACPPPGRGCSCFFSSVAMAHPSRPNSTAPT